MWMGLVEFLQKLDAENKNEICGSSKKDETSTVAGDTLCVSFCDKSARPVWYTRPKLHARNFVESLNREDEKTTTCTTYTCNMENRLYIKVKPTWIRCF